MCLHPGTLKYTHTANYTRAHTHKTHTDAHTRTYTYTKACNGKQPPAKKNPIPELPQPQALTVCVCVVCVAYLLIWRYASRKLSTIVWHISLSGDMLRDRPPWWCSCSELQSELALADNQTTINKLSHKHAHKNRLHFLCIGHAYGLEITFAKRASVDMHLLTILYSASYSAVLLPLSLSFSL